MARRPRGSVGKHRLIDGSTIYFARVEYPPDPQTGKRRQFARGRFATEQAARDDVHLWVGELIQGNAADPSLTLAALLHGQLERAAGEL